MDSKIPTALHIIYNFMPQSQKKVSEIKRIYIICTIDGKKKETTDT
jgi:hypothetical protein